jgi:SAF domain
MPPSTTLPPRPPAPAADRVAPTLVPGGGRQRRWSLALLAVLVTIGSALAFVVLWMNAGGRKPVLALRNNVAAGQLIQEDDLQVVRVSADSGITPIPSSERDDVVGEPAAANLMAGTLLVEDAIGTNHDLEQGTTVIAIPVPAARLPSDELERGDLVILYHTPGQTSTAPPRELGEGHVFSVADDDNGSGDVRVSVTVDETLGLEVATAVTADEIYISQSPVG